ncbi:MAG: alpha/beta fold hydrolase [Myxococcales bacterium]
MGEVWLGQQVVSRGLGAVKRLRHAARPSMKAFLDREGRAIARLSHPHIVPLFEMGEDHLVTAFIDGPNLERRLQTPIGPDIAIRITRQIAGALAHAHAHGVVHRDVKPSNILLDGAGNAHLADFGIADLLDEGAGPRGGTPTFMAPELLRGARSGPASDQYALGRTLLEMLVGGSIAAATEAALRDLPRGLPISLRDVVARALAIDPPARFPSMDAFAEALSAIDLAGLVAPDRLAAKRRSTEPFAWCAAAQSIEAVGTDLLRAEYRLGDLAQAGHLAAQAARSLLTTSGLADIAFSVYGCSTRLGRLTDPESAARAAEVVILLHGFGGARQLWRSMAAAVCRDNAEALVLVPDVHGFGESRFSRTPSRAQSEPAAIIRTADALRHLLGLAEIPTVILGNSMSALGLLCFRDLDLGPRVSRIALNPLVPRHDRRLRWMLRCLAAMERVVGLWAPARRVLVRWISVRELARTRLAPKTQVATLEQVLRLPARVSARLWTGMVAALLPVGRQRRLSVLSAFDDPVFSRASLMRTVAAIGLEPAQIRSLATGGHHPHVESVDHPEWTARNLAEIVHEINTMLLTARHAATTASIPGTTSGTTLVPYLPDSSNMSPQSGGHFAVDSQKESDSKTS